nr:uncharacterized protein LOC117838963 [Setaria viridis]
MSSYIFQPRWLVCCMKLRSLGSPANASIMSAGETSKKKKKISTQTAKQAYNHPINQSANTSQPANCTNQHAITVLGDERVVGCAEVDEPVPVAAEAEQQHDGVQRGGEHGGASVGDEVRPADDPNVAHGRVHAPPGHELRQPAVLPRGGLPVQVQQVAVGRVVQRRQQPRVPEDAKMKYANKIGYRGASTAEAKEADVGEERC